MNLLSLFLLLSIAINSWAIPNRQDKAFLDTQNLLPNPGFEARLAGWSEVGGGTLTVTTTNPLSGKYMAAFDPAADNDYMTTGAITILPHMVGRKCSIDFRYKWEEGSNTSPTSKFQVVVLDTGTEVLRQNVIATSSGTVHRFVGNFDCPDSVADTLEGRIEATADTVVINPDNVTIAADKNISLINQAYESLGSISTSGSFTTNTTYTAEYWRNGDKLVAEVHVAFAGAPNAGGFSVTLPSIPEFGGQLTIDTTKLPNVNTLKDLGRGIIHDPGTARYKAVAMYGGASVVRLDYLLEGANPASTTQSVTNTAPVTLASGDEFFISYEVPVTQFSDLAAKQAIRVDTLKQGIIHAYHTVDCTLPRSNNLFGLPTGDATCSVGTEKLEGKYSNVTAVLDGGNTTSGFNFDSSKAGRAFACAQTSISHSTTTRQFVLAQLVGNGTTIDEFERLKTPIASDREAVSLCGIFDTVVGSNILQIQIAGSSSAEIAITRQNLARAIRWHVVELVEDMPTPEFRELTTDVAQKVDTPDTTGRWRMCQVYVDYTAGVPAIGTQTPGCAASLVDNAVGDVTIAWDFTWGSPGPSCYGTAFSATPYIYSMLTRATTSTRMLIRSDSGAATDEDSYFLCFGSY